MSILIASVTLVANICVMAVSPAKMVYPAKGATNVPDGGFTLLLSHSESPVSLAIAGVTAVPTLQEATAPSPLRSDSTSAASKAGYVVPKLQPKTTYQVIVPLPASGCYDPNHPPAPQMTTLGTFTTQ
ncbi:MAG TPA: hypothetical protein VKT72_09005 [Candidatus Baltobacteraceae bacterium]|nr:hypothetical protein [Candidatus Baltobacteraceae bacterium]